MKNNNSTIAVQPVLSYTGVRSYLFTLLFIALAVGMPALAHLFGAPVRYLLPMHWAVILAGLVYGWRGGALSGFLAPVASFLITSMPPAPVLMPMTVELFAYGFLAGLLKEMKLNVYVSTAIALIAGRILYVISVFALGLTGNDLSAYLAASMLPGLLAAAAQVAILPSIAKWWVKKESGQND